MKEFAYTVLLKEEPAIIERYEAEHARVWPEVEASLHEIGVRRLRIFRLGRRLCMVLEAADDFDPGVAFAKHWAKGGRITEWEELMASFQQRDPTAPPGSGLWAEMKKVCDICG